METLVKNTHWAVDDSADPEVPTATLQVYDFIADYLRRPKDTHVNRASSASMCPKRRWFQKNGAPATPLTPRKMVNFLLGDLSEKSLNYFVKQGCVGPGRIYSEVSFGTSQGFIKFQDKEIHIYEQENLTADVGGIEVTAHVDGWGKRNSDGQWELLEFKSASNFGFQEFKDPEWSSDYLKQAMVNLRTGKAIELGAKSVRFYYLRKETGHIYDRVFQFDEKLFQQVIKDYAVANGPAIPETPYQPTAETFRKVPTGRMILPFPCAGYCSYVDQCFKYTVDWKSGQYGSKTPVYVTSGEKKCIS